MVAADGREYSLALDFSAMTYHVTGNGLDQGGAIQADGKTFNFQPGNATGASGTSTTRFSFVVDTVVGEYAVPTGPVPFIASRAFATSVPTTTLTFNMLGRNVDATTGAGITTTIQQAQVTSDGRLLICSDNIIYEIANCPAASTFTGTVTAAGDLLTATATAANGSIFTFRIATIGADKVLLRSYLSIDGSRRFLVGLPAETTFSGGTFVGGTTEPAWGSATLTATTFATTGTSPTGVTTTRNGTATQVGGATFANLLGVTTTDAGKYFAVAGSQLGVVVAARGSTLAPGFMAIGVRQ
jgi:hypothetical protein